MDRAVWDKILVVQTSFLGDTVLTLPLLSEIKRRFPSSKLSLLCTPLAQELLSDHPAVDEIIVDNKKKTDRGWLGVWRKARQLRSKGFTLALCPHKSFRSGLLLFLARIPFRVGFAESKSSFLFHVRVKRNLGRHDAERNLSILEGLGIPTAECRPTLDFPIRAELREKVLSRFGALGIDASRMLVGLHPGSVWATKRWSTESFARLIGMLKEKYPCEILLFGGPEDGEVIAKIQELCGGRGISLIDKVALRELPAALGLCRILVTNDSGPMHIAVAEGVPVIAIFCATTPALGFYPYSSNAIVLEKNLPCRPCSSHGGRRCPLGTEDCIHLIGPEQVFQAVERLLDTSVRTDTEAENRCLPQFV
ncbi:MAG TPA: lipopolysaccharide heptosyltransferase II, partial [Candidatus Binatia bacterium]|nr:lipopolysaccharide heptosyltransferase II [Candidatus Binatia bacterium]